MIHPQMSAPAVPQCAAAAEAHVGAPDTVVADAQRRRRWRRRPPTTYVIGQGHKVQPGASFRLLPSEGIIRAGVQLIVREDWE